MKQCEKCVCAAQKAKRLREFRLECQRAGVPIPNMRQRFLWLRTDTGALIGWVYYHDHNFSRKFSRLWTKGQELERQEKRAARAARRAVAR
jgi:hypothetical protein